MNASPIFITATGTDAGKTYVTCLLLRQAAAQGIALKAIKPVISGYKDDGNSDTARILRASGKDAAAVEECSPWRFTAPLSADIAAVKENKTIDYGELLKFCTHSSPALIEGVGGLMSPLTAQRTNLDLLQDTQSRALLVSGLYLGCISHLLTAFEVLKQRRVPLAGLVLNATTAETLDAAEVQASLAPHLPQGVPVFLLRHLPEEGNYWQQQPSLVSVAMR